MKGLFILAYTTFAGKVPYNLPKGYLPFEVAAKYAAASYCLSLYDKPMDKNYNCGFHCEGSAKGTVLDHAAVDPLSQSKGIVTHNDRLKTIIISYKGTKSFTEVLRNSKFWSVSPSWKTPPGVKIHSGFIQMYSSLRSSMTAPVLKLARKYPDYQIVFLGHSLGGALALIAATDFFENYGFEDRIFVYTFGKPRVGNREWAKYVNGMPFIDRVFRITTFGDLFVHLAPKMFGYSHEKNMYRLDKDGKVYQCEVANSFGECKERLWMSRKSHFGYWEIDSPDFECNLDRPGPIVLGSLVKN
jgi:hypothetical protein